MLFVRLSTSDPCKLCPDGSSISAEYANFSIPVAAVQAFAKTCGDLEKFALTQPSDGDFCKGLQSLSSICGCSYPSNSCNLCSNQSHVPAASFATPTTFSKMALPMIPAQCGLVEATLHRVSQDDAICTEGRQYAGDCGCPGVSTRPAAAAGYCPFCRDRGHFAHPDKNISAQLEITGVLQRVLDLGLSPTCQVVAQFVSTTILESSPDCSRSQLYLGGVCGCQPVDSFCQFCPNDDTIAYPDQLLYPLLRKNAFMSCADMNATLSQVKQSQRGLCVTGRTFNFLCGCNGGVREYLGANTVVKQAYMAWLPRVSGLASLIGSIFIIFDVFRDAKRRGSVYYQLVSAMSFFTCFSSLAWIFSTATLPSTAYGSPTGVYGASGNEATCKMEGFFLELGMIGGIFYTFALTACYVLIVIKNYREFQLKRLRVFFHAPVVLISFGFALGGIPFYEDVVVMCHVATPPLADNYVNTTIFILAPVSVALFGCVFNLSWLCWAALKQNRAARKWRMDDQRNRYNTNSANDSSSQMMGCLNCFRRGPQTTVSPGTGGRAQLDRVVLWQVGFYFASFLLTWPFYYVATLNATWENYGFWVLAGILAPLQGFFNWIVYMRPRWGQAIAKYRHRKSQQSSKSRATQNRSSPQSPHPSSKGDADASKDQTAELAASAPLAEITGGQEALVCDPLQQQSAGHEEPSKVDAPDYNISISHGASTLDGTDDTFGQEIA